MVEMAVRSIATLLLRSAIRLAPAEIRDWGQGMLGELNHVEGYRASLTWALGGAGALAKLGLAVVVTPSGSRRGFPFGGMFGGKERFMRRAIGWSAVGCVLAAVLPFAAPVFRQAFRVSLGFWPKVLNVESWRRQPDLEALAKQAETRHDAEGLAFAAVRVWEGAQSARLADEAVRLNPDLLWVYAIVAVRHPDLPEAGKWLSRLEQWDPQNGLPYLVEAERIDIGYISEAQGTTIRLEAIHSIPAWQSAMAATFRSTKFDDYLDRLRELDRKVVVRYAFNNPYEVLSGEQEGLPSYAFSDSNDFAQSLLESGQELGARGDTSGALEKFWSVARFGQLVNSMAHADDERRLSSSLQSSAYERLQAQYDKEGDHREAALFGYLNQQIHKEGRGPGKLLAAIYRGEDVSGWAATLVKVLGVAIVVFGSLALISALTVIARRRGEPKTSATGKVAAAFAFLSGVGGLLSSTALYVTYRPYSMIFQDFLSSGDTSRADELIRFLAGTHRLPGGDVFIVPGHTPYISPPSPYDFVVHFWMAATTLCILGLLAVVARHLLRHRHSGQPA
jgi:hypothetical protein